MKNSTFKKIILTILLALPLVGMAQNDDDITLSTQDEIDAFTATNITGNLTIKESIANNIISLTGLRSLTSVGGYLYIWDNDALSSLSGLQNLTSVEGFLNIRLNAALSSLSGLEGINRVGGVLRIFNNTTLSSLSGLEGINRVGGDLDIYSNAALSSLSGLENITTLGGSLNIGTNSFSENSGNPSLANLCDVRQLITNGEITNATYFVGNNGYNPSYAQIQETDACSVDATTTSLGHKTFSTQDEINDFNTNYIRITGDLTINDTTDNNITNLTALRSLISVDGNLSISSNDALSSLSGLENITILGGSLNIGTNSSSENSGNPSLANLCDVRQLITNGEITNATYFVGNNGYNPSYAQIQETDACSVDATTTYLGHETFSTQTEIDAFTTTYTGIAGNLTIQGTDNSIISLSGLSGINRVGGNLSIYSNAALSSLSGLENITTLGGSLNIGTNSSDAALGNSALTNLCGVRQLITNGEVTNAAYFVGNNVANPEYAELQNAASCIATTYTGSLTLTSQIVIADFPYTNITGNLIIEETTDNDITNLSNLSGITSVGGYLNISHNAALSSLSGLDDLTSVGGYLRIWNNDALTSLSSLDDLTSVGGYFNISFNESLTSLSGLDGINRVGGDLQITSNYALSSLSALNDLASVGGDLHIQSNSALSSLSGLDSINRVGGGLNIQSNSALSSLSGLDGLTSVGGYLHIRSNVALSSLSGLNALTSVGEYLAIYGNTALSSLRALDGINRVEENLTIWNNDALTSLSGLDNINRVEGYLTIRSNATLSSLSGLEGVTSVGGVLWIFSNAALSSLSGLENITTLGGNLNEDFSPLPDPEPLVMFSPIFILIGTNSSNEDLGNPNLANLCGIQQLIANGEVTSEGYFVKNNAYNPTYASLQGATTCNNGTASVGDFIEKGESIAIFPNPAKDILHIESEESITFVEIINTLGQVVLKTTESKDIHIGFLPSGVYFVKVTDGLQATLVKILKN